MGQQLNHHPHVHMVVPAGGLGKNGNWKTTKQNGCFLFDVKLMSSKFSGMFVSKPRKLKMKGKIVKYVPKDLIKEPWVVYAKQAFGSPESVVGYLGRYSHGVAISNARILKVTGTHVTFSWRNRKQNYGQETETITGEGFLKRFSEHIVPPYFGRIRHLGFLSARGKRDGIQTIRISLNLAFEEAGQLTRGRVLELRFGERSLLKRKECGGHLTVLETYPNQRAPPAAANQPEHPVCQPLT